MDRHQFTYIIYTDLLPFDDRTNFLRLMREISTGIMESDNIEDLITSINSLRRMRKNHRDLFNPTFNNICSSLVRLVLDDNITVSKLTLIFISEIFSVFEYETINEWIPHLLPAVIEASISSIPMIKDEALKALSNLSNNMFYEETIECLIELIQSENAQIARNAADTLCLFFTYIDSNVLLDGFNWQSIFVKVEELSSTQTDSYSSYIGASLYAIQHKLKDKFQCFLGNLIDDQARLAVELVENYKKTNNFS